MQEEPAGLEVTHLAQYRVLELLVMSSRAERPASLQPAAQVAGRVAAPAPQSSRRQGRACHRGPSLCFEEVPQEAGKSRVGGAWGQGLRRMAPGVVCGKVPPGRASPRITSAWIPDPGLLLVNACALCSLPAGRVCRSQMGRSPELLLV